MRAFGDRNALNFPDGAEPFSASNVASGLKADRRVFVVAEWLANVIDGKRAAYSLQEGICAVRRYLAPRGELPIYGATKAGPARTIKRAERDALLLLMVRAEIVLHERFAGHERDVREGMQALAAHIARLSDPAETLDMDAREFWFAAKCSLAILDHLAGLSDARERRERLQLQKSAPTFITARAAHGR